MMAANAEQCKEPIPGMQRDGLHVCFPGPRAASTSLEPQRNNKETHGKKELRVEVRVEVVHAGHCC